MLRLPTIELKANLLLPFRGILFPGMFGHIPQNFSRHSPECLRTFPGMFGDIPRNFLGHSPEYNIPPISRVPSIPFPVPVFMVLYIAQKFS